MKILTKIKNSYVLETVGLILTMAVILTMSINAHPTVNANAHVESTQSGEELSDESPILTDMLDPLAADSVTSVESENIESSSVTIEIETTTVVSTTPSSTEGAPTPSEPQQYTEYGVPSNQSGFKSWMPASAISKKSQQWKIVQMAKPDENGLYKIGDDYLVALGSYYSRTLGDRFEITLSSGKVFTMVLADMKADVHTDSTNRVSSNGCMTEFIINRSTLNPKISRSGSVSSVGFEGTVTKVVKIGSIYD